MKLLKRALNSLAIALIISLAVSVIAIVVLAFTEGREPGRYSALWGSVFYESGETEAGGIRLGFGISNLLPLLVFSVCCAVVLFALFSYVAAKRDRELKTNPQR